MGEIVYSPKAIEDIERIRDYIRDELLNPPAAQRIVGAIFDAGDSLYGRACPGTAFRSGLALLKHYRYLTVENYLLIFRVQDSVVKIVRVLHHLQDTISILLHEPEG